MKCKRIYARLTALSLTAIMMLACVNLQTGAAESGQVDEAASDNLIGALSYTYADYLKDCEEKGAAPYKGESLEFGIEAVVPDTTAYQEAGGVKAAASTETHPQLTFKISVAQEGMYQISTRYIFLTASGFNGSRKLLIDGKSIYLEADNIAFNRKFVDAAPPRTNALGDQVKPSAKEILEWQSSPLFDNMGRYSDPLTFYLTAGVHILTFVYDKQDMLISGITLAAPITHISYAEYNKSSESADITGFSERIQAENAMLYRNNSAIGLSSDGDPRVTPSKPGFLLMNTVGGYSFRDGGQSITFKVTVDKAGDYCLNFRSKQTWSVRMNSYRKIEINGEVPFEEANCVAFPYHTKWQNVILGEKGNPYRFRLKQGENTITLTSVLGPNTETIRLLEKALNKLSMLSRKITMIIGVNPDPNYDYDLAHTIPGLEDSFKEIVELLDQTKERCNAQNGGKDTVIGNGLETNIKMLREMTERPEQIPKRTSDLNNIITGLGNNISSLQEQPLQFDYIELFSPDIDIPEYRSNFFDNFAATLKSLIISFSKDYSALSADTNGKIAKSLDVWIGRGREWAEIMKEIVDSDFTARTGIELNLNVVPSGGLSSSGTANLLLLSITAGTQPDIAMGVSTDMPVEYAIRGVVSDLSKQEGYRKLISRFPDKIMIPFEYKGGTYGLPETVGFRSLFYRADIMEELGLDVPASWDEIFTRLLPALNENGMQFYLPNWLDYFVLSCGGTYYRFDSKGNVQSAFDTPEVYKAFKMLTDAYVVHALPTAASFFNRFRTGEMPIGLGDNALYLQLKAAAPELNGKWKVAPLPGIRQDDGNVVCRYPNAAGSAMVILEASSKQKEAWQFADWWFSDETQKVYSQEVESRMGTSARWMTSNTKALCSLPWEKDVIDTIKDSWSNMSGIPNVLGGYYTGRHINNAWNRVVINGMLPRESLERAVSDINKELERKREQLENK